MDIHLYIVSHLLVHLCGVDLNFECSTIYLILLGQNRLGKMVEHPNQSQSNPRTRADGTFCSLSRSYLHQEVSIACPQTRRLGLTSTRRGSSAWRTPSSWPWRYGPPAAPASCERRRASALPPRSPPSSPSSTDSARSRSIPHPPLRCCRCHRPPLCRLLSLLFISLHSTSTLKLWIKCTQHISTGETCLKIARARNALQQGGQYQYRGSRVQKLYMLLLFHNDCVRAVKSLPPGCPCDTIFRTA